MTLDLSTVTLAHGSHRSRDDGVCLMEAVAWFAGEPHSDEPQCVSPYLRNFGVRLNDLASDERRQELLRFVPLVVGTAGDGLDEKRRWLAADHAVRVATPKWLDRAELGELADKLRALAPIVDHATYDAAYAAIQEARDVTWQARRERRAKIQAAVKQALVEKFGSVVAAAVAADVVVAAVVAADAAADVAATAAVAADADADVAAAADVAATAAAAAVVAVAADAVVAAAADAVELRYPDKGWWKIRDEVYKRVRALYEERHADPIAESWQEAIDLFSRLIDPA